MLGVSTAALIIFHLIGARMGVVTGDGLLTLVRRHRGMRVTHAVLAALLVANVGTMCAEFAGVASSLELLGGISRYLSIPLAGIVVSVLVLRGSFNRVEHILLVLSAVFVTYIASGFLAHPDWGEAGKGLVVPHIPFTRDAVLVAVATLGTTLAPWGLVFIQSYAADKKLKVEDLRFENVDVLAGALMTGIIGFFVVVACAATLHVHGVEIDDAKDAAQALQPLAGGAASTLFGVGFLGAALLAAAVVPLSTAYSVAEASGKRADIDDTFAQAPLFYATYGAVVLVAAALVLIPGAPLIQILYLSQALNAVLLLVLLPVMRRLAADPEVMGEEAIGTGGRLVTGGALALIAASVIALGVLTVLG